MFAPTKQIRDIKSEDFIGKYVTFLICHGNNQMDKDKVITDHYLSSQNDIGCDIFLSGWAGKKVGKIKSKIKKKIVDFVLIEKSNGGRTDTSEHRSYKSFFSSKRKKIIEEMLSDPFNFQFKYSGDPDRADTIVRFNDFEIESTSWSVHYPYEWYSDFHKKNKVFEFENGFYASADEAIDAFERKSVDDLFGTRYFPVIVMPKKKHGYAQNIAMKAKSCSNMIAKGRNVIIATRCKEYEYDEIISDTYSCGGKIPIDVEWNW